VFAEFRAPRRVVAALERIERDRRRGASELAAQMVDVLAYARPARGITRTRYVGALRRLVSGARRLRPTMVPIGNVAGRIFDEAAPAMQRCEEADEAYAVLAKATEQLRGHMSRMPQEVTRHLRKRYPRLRRPLLISYSSLVVKVLGAWPRRMRVTVCESRPALEGRRTASLLRGRAASVAVITEAQAAIALDDCDSVVMGCDAIDAHGAVVNKTGSYLLALAAREAALPVVVLGDTLKLAPSLPRRPEAHSPQDVWRNPPRGVTARNVCFERVPPACIDCIVLETGTYRPRAIQRLIGATKGRSR
jgi:translation initiation factor eIF-2B subunit delta